MSKNKPGNAKEALERLSKHYGLNKSDFYELHGVWILKHSAVQKMATMPSIDGHRIEISPIQTSMHEGLFGKEVVMNATFSLVSKDGDTVYSSEMFGEANPKNTKIPYPWAMAHKRLHDRGVLLVLALAQFHIYSDVERDEWKDRTPPPQPAPTPTPVSSGPVRVSPPVEAPKPNGGPAMPRRSVPVPSVPSSLIPPAEKAAEDPQDSIDTEVVIMNLFVAEPEAKLKRGEIINMTGLTRHHAATAIRSLVSDGRIVCEGKTNGARYCLPSEDEAVQEPEQLAVDTGRDVGPDEDPITMEEWNKAQADLLNVGGNMMQISRIIAEITGHGQPYMAVQSGAITRSHLKVIEQRIAAGA
jgi:hypothetical protein